MEETPEKRTAAGYFFTIVLVLGASLLMPPFTVLFMAMGPILLLALTPALLIGYTRYKRGRGRNSLRSYRRSQ